MHKGNWRSIGKKTIVGIAVASTALVAVPVLANHAWGTYHWAKPGSQVTAPVGDNVSSAWDSYLQTAVNDWNQSTVIQSPLVSGSTSPRTCKAVAGTIQACNATYGQNGWLGLATIWLSNGHISQATTKVNDTYFNMAQYNTPSWKAAVMCQEIGHNYGLGHQDENFNDDRTTSCMEYTSWPQGNEHPDAHDYEQLLLIYNHVDSAAAVSSSRAPSLGAAGDTPAEWGRAVDTDAQGRPNVFMQDLGNGHKKITHVTWAIGEGPQNHKHHDH